MGGYLNQRIENFQAGAAQYQNRAAMISKKDLGTISMTANHAFLTFKDQLLYQFLQLQHIDHHESRQLGVHGTNLHTMSQSDDTIPLGNNEYSSDNRRFSACRGFRCCR
jgi:hypothetical protein